MDTGLDVEALRQPLASEPIPTRLLEPSLEGFSELNPAAQLSASIKHSVSLDDRHCSHGLTDGALPLREPTSVIPEIPSMLYSKGPSALPTLPNGLEGRVVSMDRITRSVGGDPLGKAQVRSR